MHRRRARRRRRRWRRGGGFVQIMFVIVHTYGTLLCSAAEGGGTLIWRTFGNVSALAR